MRSSAAVVLVTLFALNVQTVVGVPLPGQSTDLSSSDNTLENKDTPGAGAVNGGLTNAEKTQKIKAAGDIETGSGGVDKTHNKHDTTDVLSTKNQLDTEPLSGELPNTKNTVGDTVKSGTEIDSAGLGDDTNSPIKQKPMPEEKDASVPEKLPDTRESGTQDGYGTVALRKSAKEQVEARYPDAQKRLLALSEAKCESKLKKMGWLRSSGVEKKKAGLRKIKCIGPYFEGKEAYKNCVDDIVKSLIKAAEARHRKVPESCGKFVRKVVNTFYRRNPLRIYGDSYEYLNNRDLAREEADRTYPKKMVSQIFENVKKNHEKTNENVLDSQQKDDSLNIETTADPLSSGGSQAGRDTASAENSAQDKVFNEETDVLKRSKPSSSKSMSRSSSNKASGKPSEEVMQENQGDTDARGFSGEDQTVIANKEQKGPQQTQKNRFEKEMAEHRRELLDPGKGSSFERSNSFPGYPKSGMSQDDTNPKNEGSKTLTKQNLNTLKDNPVPKQQKTSGEETGSNGSGSVVNVRSNDGSMKSEKYDKEGKTSR